MPQNSISKLYTHNPSQNLIQNYVLTSPSGVVSNIVYRGSESKSNSYIVEVSRSGGASTPTNWALTYTASSGSFFSGTGLLLPGNGWTGFVQRWQGYAPLSTSDVFSFTFRVNGTGIPGQPSLIWTEFKLGIIYGTTYALVYQETFPGGSLNFTKTYYFAQVNPVV
jgi:hypothetical protein